MLISRTIVCTASLSLGLLVAACIDEAPKPEGPNAYVQSNFVANKPSYKAATVEKTMINALGHR